MSSMRTRPSTIEYSEWTRRWVKIGAVIVPFYLVGKIR